MQDSLEHLIKLAYKKWKEESSRPQEAHPDEEALACFLQGKLSAGEKEELKSHLLSCASCSEALAMQARLQEAGEEREVPEQLLEQAKGLISVQEKESILEILLRFKEKTIELLNTTGDVLVGQELIPAPVLRSRDIKDFKDEVIILKDFQDIRVEVRIENKEGGVFNVTITAKEKQTQKLIKDLRVTLLKEDVELESYLNDTGSVIFEHVLLGKYRLDISNIDNKLASILLDIKI